jgi:hypothetical protein
MHAAWGGEETETEPTVSAQGGRRDRGASQSQKAREAFTGVVAGQARHSRGGVTTAQLCDGAHGGLGRECWAGVRCQQGGNTVCVLLRGVVDEVWVAVSSQDVRVTNGIGAELHGKEPGRRGKSRRGDPSRPTFLASVYV